MVLTPGTSQATSVTVRQKDLPYRLRVTLRKLVELYIKVSIIV